MALVERRRSFLKYGDGSFAGAFFGIFVLL
jgi:hypothetical protein